MQSSDIPVLKDKVVVVTGGTGGIGMAVCEACAAEGASVVVVDLNQDRIDSAVSRLNEAAPCSKGHLGLKVDVSSETDCVHMAQATLERFGRIDALVASAGILRLRGTSPKPIVDVTLEEWDQVIDVNLKGVFLTNRAVLPAMIQQRGGCIINVSSVQGLLGRANDGVYCASKFGVIGLSQAIAEEVKSYGIKVQAIMPHAVDTPMWDQNGPIPRPSFALPPERVAELILFMLAQPEDTVLMGTVIAPLGARKRKKFTGQAEGTEAAGGTA